MGAVNADDFYVDDEPLEEVEAAFAAGRPVVTSRPTGRPRQAGGPRFVLTQTKSGQFLFHLRSANGTVIVTSEHYATKGAALRAIEAVKAGAPGAAIESTVV